MSKSMILKPRISEKAYGLSQTARTYVFHVPSEANKLSVAAAVEAQFSVVVVNVNIANAKGKTKRTIRKGGRPVFGKRADQKRAYVTLKEGDSITVFAAEEEADAKAKDTKTKKGKK